VIGHRRQVDDARREPDGQPAVTQGEQEAAHARHDGGPPRRRAGEEQHVQLLWADVGGADPRMAIPRRAHDEVHRSCRAQDVDEGGGIGSDLGRARRNVEEDRVALAPAHVEAHRAGVDAEHPAHGAPSLAGSCAGSCAASAPASSPSLR